MYLGHVRSKLVDLLSMMTLLSIDHGLKLTHLPLEGRQSRGRSHLKPFKFSLVSALTLGFTPTLGRDQRAEPSSARFIVSSLLDR